MGVSGHLSPIPPCLPDYLPVPAGNSCHRNHFDPQTQQASSETHPLPSPLPRPAAACAADPPATLPRPPPTSRALCPSSKRNTTPSVPASTLPSYNFITGFLFLGPKRASFDGLQTSLPSRPDCVSHCSSLPWESPPPPCRGHPPPFTPSTDQALSCFGASHVLAHCPPPSSQPAFLGEPLPVQSVHQTFV